MLPQSPVARGRSTPRRPTCRPREGNFAITHLLTPSLADLPTLALLEWIDLPVLGMARDGSIVFANWSFARMLGYTPEMVQAMSYDHLFGLVPEGGSPLAVLRANAELTIDLTHLDGSFVQAKVSEPFPFGSGDVTLTTFHDVTEQPWEGY